MDWQSGLGHCIRPEEPLASYCWLRLGGPAEFFATPTTIEELTQIVQRAAEARLPMRVLGNGSNLLVGENGVRGLVLNLSAPAFTSIQVAGTQITSGGGASLSHTVIAAVREGLSGLEGLVSIPGTVGGALHGNAGDRTASVGDCFASATVLTREAKLLTRTREDVDFGYRQSSLDELVIVSATFELTPMDRDELTRRMQKRWIVMRSELPARERRTACLFRDPMGQTAKELIDAAGLKGYSVGGAALFERDTNYVVIQNDAATAQDVKELIELIRRDVEDKTGVQLQTALQIW